MFRPSPFRCSAGLLDDAGLAAAQTPLYRGEYTISFLGLTLRGSISTAHRRPGYSIEGEASARAWAPFRRHERHDHRFRTLRRRRPGRPFPRRLPLRQEADLVDIRFSGGNVAAVVNVPPLKKRGKDWVPIEPADLKSVVDPIAATLVKADRLDDVCNGSARMFDGELRADLTLSYVRTGDDIGQGLRGPTVTCRLDSRPWPAIGRAAGRWNSSGPRAGSW